MTTGGHSGADPRGLATALIGDGRPLLTFTGLMLVLSGLFALFLSVSGNFLPHDVAYLQMTSGELCSINECRIVHFMFHDRVSFGGSLIAIGTLYLWIVEFPLRQRQPWAWWLLVLSGLLGFGSFLAYLGYGYLDTWHGAATLALLPCFLIGLKKTGRILDRPARASSLLRSVDKTAWATPDGIGRLLLLITAGSLAVGGLIIMTVGMTSVFVPQDLQFMGLTTERLQALNPRLIPLIAHDRAGFGGGVFTCGVTMFFCIWCGEPSRSLWQALLITGIAGFGTAIAVHPAIGYTDLFHLGPALLGAAMFVVGIALTYQQYNRRAPSSVG